MPIGPWTRRVGRLRIGEGFDPQRRRWPLFDMIAQTPTVKDTRKRKSLEVERLKNSWLVVTVRKPPCRDHFRRSAWQDVINHRVGEVQRRGEIDASRRRVEPHARVDENRCAVPARSFEASSSCTPDRAAAAHVGSRRAIADTLRGPDFHRD